jgi:hypothetical protein
MTITHGTGHGWLKCFAPANTAVRLAGQGTTDLVTFTTPGLGTSAVEFLHVMCLSPAATPFMPSLIALIEDTGRSGVTLRDRQGQIWSVAFQRGAAGLLGVETSGTVEPPSIPGGVSIVP